MENNTKTYKALDEYEVLKAKKSKRKRKLTARDGIKTMNRYYRLDEQTNKVLLSSEDLIPQLLGLKVSDAVILRRALRLYAKHLYRLAKGVKEVKGRDGFHQFLERLENERRGLFAAACRDPE